MLKSISITLLALASLSSAMCAEDFKKPDPDVWYRIVTMYDGPDARQGRCIQYFPEGSAHPGLIWSAEQIADADPASDYQYWRFEPSPDNPDDYAIICKAAPEGFLDDDPTSFNAEGRWKYVTEASSGVEADDRYGFKFGAIKAGIDNATGDGYADIYTDYSSAALFRYLNCAGESQGYAINVGQATAPQGSNEWLFRFSPKQPISGVEGVVMDSCPENVAGSAPKVYDIYGRHIVNPGHGLYIVNGEKVIL